MQDLRGGYSASQLPVNIDILRIDDVCDTNFGRRGLRTFIYPSCSCDV